MKHMLVLLALCASLCAPAMAVPLAAGPNEDSLRPVLFAFRLGAFAGFGYNRHRTVQDVFPGGSECGRFVDGEGNGWYGGITAELPVLPWLRGTLRLGYEQLDGSMRVTCDNGIIVPRADGSFEPLIREHRKDAFLHYGMLEIAAKIRPLELPLFASVGIGLGAPIFGATYDQSERIVSPSDALFPGNVATRRLDGGALEPTQTRMALAAGLGYTFTLHNGVEASPFAEYVHAFENVTASGDDWRVHRFRAGVSVTWDVTVREAAPPPPAPMPVAPPPPPTPIVEAPPPKPRPTIAAATDARIAVTETYVTETFPLLPYVFFDKDADTLKSIYTRGLAADGSAQLRENDLPRETLAIYHRLLDITGARMREDASIRVTLVGSTDDRGSEAGNVALARGRAEAVRAWLVERWGIDGERIRTTVQALPPVPTSRVYAEGDEENRRVDIVSESAALFRPVVHERFSEYELTPPRLVMALGAQGEARVARWDVRVVRGSDVLARFDGTGAPPDSLAWQPDDAVAALVRDGERLRAVLTLVDERGVWDEASLEIPVTKTVSTYEVGRLSLIVFDFDRADISPQNRRMISRFVSTAITPESTVRVTGSTDALGEAVHNERLSAARAENVKAIILEARPAYRSLEARGIGEAPHLYDNLLPEGRFYCRTVAVEVRTPLK
jgi:outer membrane protein OmpA-like peptidoglycan-associated protein